MLSFTNHLWEGENAILLTTLIHAISLFWVFVIGASIGSFLNVVIYRLPLGLKLHTPKSHCPNCQTEIKSRHNVPVLGWLILRGKCASCSSSISVRYPAVEFLTASIFLLLFLAEVSSGGANQPDGPLTVQTSLADVLWNPHFLLLGRYAFHLVFGCLLIAASFIDFDAQRIPRLLLLVALCCGLFLPFCCERLHPVPLWTPLPTLIQNATWTLLEAASLRDFSLVLNLKAPLQSLCGVLLGILMGSFLETLISQQSRMPNGTSGNCAKTSAIVGLFLGWQAVLILLPLCLGMLLLFPLFQRKELTTAYKVAQKNETHIPLSIVVSLSTLLLLMNWKRWHHFFSSLIELQPLWKRSIVILFLSLVPAFLVWWIFRVSQPAVMKEE